MVSKEEVKEAIEDLNSKTNLPVPLHYIQMVEREYYVECFLSEGGANYNFRVDDEKFSRTVAHGFTEMQRELWKAHVLNKEKPI